MDPNQLQFQAKLKEIYRKQDKIAQLIEGLDKIPQQSLKDYYIKLQTIIKEDEEKKHGNYEDISGEKQSIELQDLFSKLSNDKEPHKVLVLGAAGIGKTTILQYITYRWSVGELWADKFDYVYRASLKTLLNKDWRISPWAYQPHQLNDSLLKCLIHHHLSLGVNHREIKTLPPPEDLPLGGDKKTLVLLDGYDEVAHLAGTTDFKILEEEIFEHEYLIMTSRPNAVKKALREKFDRRVENMGLDDYGINQYFQQYFRDNAQKGRNLHRFLSDNPLIKSICHVPVNIAMLCYIWSETESDAKLNEISRINNLYQEVVNRLGYRFIAKHFREAMTEGASLQEKLGNGEFTLDELKVLTHTAFKGMTGGGIANNSTRDDKKDKLGTLIIQGALDDKLDQDGISIQSSINFLASQRQVNNDQRRKVTVSDVFNYGLIKFEGASVKNDQSETDFQKQTYSFIHLTFQEHLTARYLKELLKNGNEQDKADVYQFIASHRNEPRYLMVLKFMAGAVTQEKSIEDKDALQKMFWDSVVCNVDGIIELGVETKVSLLMHLLSQAKRDGAIDSRIPNKEQIINLIDAVLLSDLVGWTDQIKASDYMNDNIKQGILSIFSEEGQTQWCLNKIQEIRLKSSPEVQLSIDILLRRINDWKMKEEEEGKLYIKGSSLAIISTLVVKFSSEELSSILDKLRLILSNHKIYQWQVVKQAINTSKTILEAQSPVSKDKGYEWMNIFDMSLPTKELALVRDNACVETFLATLNRTKMADFAYEYKKKTFISSILPFIYYSHYKFQTTDWVLEAVETLRSFLEGNSRVAQTLSEKIICFVYQNDSNTNEFLSTSIWQLCNIIEEDDIVFGFIEKLSKICDTDSTYTKSIGNAFELLIKRTTNKKVETLVATQMLSMSQHSCMLSLILSVVMEKPTVFEHGTLVEYFTEYVISHPLYKIDWLFFDLMPKAPRELQVEFLNNLCTRIADRSEGYKIAIGNLCQLSKDLDKSLLPRCFELLAGFLNNQEDKDVLVFILRIVCDMLQTQGNNWIEAHVFDNLVSLLSNKNKGVKFAAIKALEEISRRKEDKLSMSAWAELINRINEKDEDTLVHLMKVISSHFTECILGKEEKRDMIQSLNKMKILIHTDSEAVYTILVRIYTESKDDAEMRKDCFEIVMSLSSHEDAHIRLEAIRAATNMSKMAIDKELEDKFVEKVLELPDKDRFTGFLLDTLAHLLDKRGGKKSAPAIFEKISKLINAFDLSNLFISEDISQAFSNLKDKELASLALERVLTLLEKNSQHENRRNCIQILAVIVSLLDDRELGSQVCTRVITSIRQNDKTLVGLPMEIVNLIIEAKDKHFAMQSLVDFSNHIYNSWAERHSNDEFKKYLSLYQGSFPTMVIRIGDRELASKCIEYQLQHIEKEIGDIDYQFIALQSIGTIVIKFSLTSLKDFLRYLKYPKVREHLGREFLDIFEKFTDKISVMEELLKDIQILEMDAIKTKLPFVDIHALNPQEAINIVESNLVAFKKSKNAEDLTKFQNSLVRGVNRIGFRCGHELIELALSIIGYESSEDQNDERRKIVDVARKFLGIQLKYLSDDGLEWISQNIETLVRLSSDSKLFCKKLYHKLLEDNQITPLEKDLIIKLINQGLTTSMSRNGEVILEDSKYPIEADMLMLEEIARAVINQEQDVLGIQYKTHKPLFPKSIDAGIKKASSDIEVMYSIVNKAQILSSDEWILTQLHDSNNKGLALLEQRSALGDHLLYHIDNKKLFRITGGPEDTQAKLQEIFGKYVQGKKYSGKSIILDNQKAAQIISNQSLDDTKISEAQSKTYFLDELLGLSNKDRLAYFEEELGNKMTNYEKSTNSALKKSAISLQDIGKIKEYYKAFVGTFAAVYTTSQVIDSGQVTLNTSPDSTTSLISTLASFAPFIGNTLSSQITSAGEFLKNREMLNSARKMKQLASDSVSLNQLIGECASQIVFNQDKQKQIIRVTDADFEKLPGSISGDIMKFIENFQGKVNDQLYKQMFPSAAARLGNNDANETIQQWIAGTVKSETVQEQFISLATQTRSIGDHGDGPIDSDPRKCCCQLFVMIGAEYDNPLLNRPELLQKLAAKYGRKSVNQLINHSIEVGFNTMRDICDDKKAVESFLVKLLYNNK